MSKNYEATKRAGYEALEAGNWVLFHTSRGTNADFLSGMCEIYEGCKSRPRLGAIHRDDRTGGFSVGDEVHVSETATARHWLAMQETIVRSPFAGRDGRVIDILDDQLSCVVDFEDGTAVFPFDWLCRA